MSPWRRTLLASVGLALAAPPSGFTLGANSTATVQIVNVSVVPQDWSLKPSGVGVGETSKTVTVATVDDSSSEGDETFIVVLYSAVQAAIDDGEGIGTITDND